MADLIASSSGGAGTSTVASPETLATIAGFGLSEAEVARLMGEAVAWSATNGLQMMLSSESSTHAPFSLLPMRFPASEFNAAADLSALYNLLVDRVSRDPDWLCGVLKGVIEHDQFTGRLVAICDAARADAERQEAYLGIFRSDYMLHEPVAAPAAPGAATGATPAPRLLQVELNTIASSFASLGSKVASLHRFLAGRHIGGDGCARLRGSLGVDGDSAESVATAVEEHLPHNRAIEELPAAIAAAHAHYGATEARATILFVVQPGEVNTVDQRWLEYALWEKHGALPVLRRTLGEVHAQAELVGERRRLILTDAAGIRTEVTVAYFRAGYRPEDYPAEAEWAARLLVERSFAIKCPSIAYHLAGTKKVQQVLAAPSMLERFLSADEAVRLRASFAGLYDLDDLSSANTAAIVQKASAEPENFVLKPQREGGGNNFYGQELRESLATMPPKELAGYILMQRIFPRKYPAILVRGGRYAAGNTISELGMFGVILADKDRVVLNKHAGYLLRTKLEGTDEGGVATGFAVLNAPWLQ